MSEKLRIGHYVLGQTLGVGSFGKVKVGKHYMTGYKVAIKILSRKKIKSLDVVGKIKREIQNLKNFRHPHIIKLYQVISTPSDIFMIMEYVNGGELFDYIVKHGKLKESESRRFFQQIISGINYCHQNMVVHRDLKPENLLLDQKKNVKIADFGLSNMMTDGEFLSTSCGSPNYAAPEVISGKLYAGPEVDIWSCGIILFALLCGSLPFDDDNIPVLFKKIKSGQFHYPIPNHPSCDAKNLISKMLNVDPIQRITIEEIKVHPWFNVDLPKYLFPMYAEASSVIDSAAVLEVCQKFHVCAKDVHNAILCNDPTSDLLITYNLIVDNKKSCSDLRKDYDSFFVAGKTFELNTLSYNTSSSTKVHPETMPPLLKADDTVLTEAQSKKSGKELKKSKWHLGIRSQSRPNDIMSEVYKAMKELGYEWKNASPFNLWVKCKLPNGGCHIKMILQLYQVDQKCYLLDFKNYVLSDDCCNSREKEETNLQLAKSKSSNYLEVIDDDFEINIKDAASSSQSDLETIDSELDSQYERHSVLGFFEICAKLISKLAK